MKLLTVDTIEEARAKLLDAVKDWRLQVECIKTEEALGRFLAEDLHSSCDLPAFNRATVDGYAVIAADTAGAGESIPVFLSLTGHIEMGKRE
ncbi:MAG: hypothetical protein LBG94_10055 [Treponema sp.]|jgi:molybdopterin molybdotransferase|nr:hypothetical protein [Treponema sp.]